MSAVTREDRASYGWVVELWPSPERPREAAEATTRLIESAAGSPKLVSLARQDSQADAAVAFTTIRLSFDSAAAVHAWDDRARQLLAEDSEAWHRRPEIASSDNALPSEITEVITARVDPALEAEYQALRAEVTRLVSQRPGFVSISSEPSDDAGTWLTEITFSDTVSLEAWQRDPERTAVVSRLRALAADETRLLPAGFGRWVSTTDPAIATTPTWKSAMVVVAVLYPLVSILDMTMGNFLANELGWVLPQQAFLGNVVGTILLTWLLMPLATRVAQRFLDPGASPATTRRGVLALLAVYVAEVAIFWWIYATFNV